MPKLNPKDMKPQVYKDPRPAEYFAAVPRSARKGVGWIYDFVRMILTIPTILFYRTRAIGVENVPAAGPVILAPNHFSQMDHFFAGRLPAAEDPLHGEVAALREPRASPTSSSTAASSRCGAVTTTRRRSRPPTRSSTAAACMLIYAEGGRSRTGELGRAEARHRPDRARVRRAGRPGRDPRLGARARLEAPPASRR